MRRRCWAPRGACSNGLGRWRLLLGMDIGRTDQGAMGCSTDGSVASERQGTATWYGRLATEVEQCTQHCNSIGLFGRMAGRSRPTHASRHRPLRSALHIYAVVDSYCTCAGATQPNVRVRSIIISWDNHRYRTYVSLVCSRLCTPYQHSSFWDGTLTWRQPSFVRTRGK